MPRTKKAKSSGDDSNKKLRTTNDILTKDDDDMFVVSHIEDDDAEMDEQVDRIPRSGRDFQRQEIIPSTVVKDLPDAGETVKVKFSKFATLVANNNFQNVIDRNEDEDIIISSNLLTDLAGSYEKEEERRIPAIFIVGMVLGIVITYILLTF